VSARFVVPAAWDGERIDRVLATETGRSRSAVRAMVEGGLVRIDGEPQTTPSHRVREGDEVEAEVPDEEVTELEADPGVDFAVAYEDHDVVVVDKPAGLVVHPGHGTRDPTLANGLLSRYPELRGIGEPDRPGILHRLDVGTTGLLLVARTEKARMALAAAMAARTIHRRYDVLASGVVSSDAGLVDAPIGRSPRDPTLMAVVNGGREARTRYEVTERMTGSSRTLLHCELETGRTHQIRVHLSAIEHPVAGDVRYGGPPDEAGRPLLHARQLVFPHPSRDEDVTVEAPWPADFTAAVERARRDG
jgi:23S rRNA pseudouridine1911/1915/1917 synthase